MRDETVAPSLKMWHKRVHIRGKQNGAYLLNTQITFVSDKAGHQK
jgi:hypothetical protein